MFSRIEGHEEHGHLQGKEFTNIRKIRRVQNNDSLTGNQGNEDSTKPH
jgi:hypothetical protein